ncbi:NAD(P)-dependent oxidoreductase [Prauserella cavernicola]|uniref:NAD(P)-dependent oxidoreductase n=1 Tax=Prauserella cavernicola TaxID=2800127 RepID=A0A934V3J2_9PSEU|nr:NAD(P)-binding domain-containing protein [Prauserella cavernicola]MBK1783085.1 NAD(P)-dependent oxidoreductase [Prauserella cavernicola]
MTDVTLIGLGPMGQAMIRTFLAHGHTVTVWNRTASRADEVVAAGAVRAASPADALAASELVILSLTDYQAMYDILGGVTSALAGKVVVNLSSDTPSRTREADAWLAGHGATLVVGGVMVPAPMVGTEHSYVFYSGPKETFLAHEPVLRLLGRPEYRGEDPILAQLYYQAQLTLFLTSLSAYLQAAALLRAEGVPVGEFLPFAVDMYDTFSPFLAGTAEELESRTYPGELSTATMMGATADHIVAANREAGVDVALPEAVKSLYDRAIAAGHGSGNWTSLWEVIRARD